MNDKTFLATLAELRAERDAAHCRAEYWIGLAMALTELCHETQQSMNHWKAEAERLAAELALCQSDAMPVTCPKCKQHKLTGLDSGQCYCAWCGWFDKTFTIGTVAVGESWQLVEFDTP